MIKNTIKLAGLAAALQVASSHAFAEVKLNDNLSLSGYISGGYQNYDPSPGPAVDSFFGNKGAPIDTAQLLLTGTFKPVTGVASLYYAPNAPYETTLLDAYVTYAPEGPLSITAGKFLSYLGYESFFTVNNPELSYANGDFLAPIPGYHSGIKLDVTNPAWTTGVALLDSVYSPPGAYLKGDGELKGNAGFEGYVAIKSIPDFTLWGGVAYDTKGNGLIDSTTTWDFWAEWQTTKMLKLAAEYANKDSGKLGKGDNWLVLANFAFTDKFYTAFRVSGEKVKGGGPEFTKWTVAPGVKLTEQLTVKAELSAYDYNNFTASTAVYWGVNGVLKF